MAITFCAVTGWIRRTPFPLMSYVRLPSVPPSPPSVPPSPPPRSQGTLLAQEESSFNFSKRIEKAYLCVTSRLVVLQTGLGLNTTFLWSRSCLGLSVSRSLDLGLAERSRRDLAGSGTPQKIST